MDNSKNRTTGGPLDVKEDDVLIADTETELKGAGDTGEVARDEETDPGAATAGLRYGRDSVVLPIETDPEEDNYAPGVKEQD